MLLSTLTPAVGQMAVACIQVHSFRHWLRFHTENSRWSFHWPDHTVHCNKDWAWESISGAASESESIDGGVGRHCRRTGCQWTAPGSEGTVSHARRICLRCRCHCTGWSWFVFVLHFINYFSGPCRTAVVCTCVFLCLRMISVAYLAYWFILTLS